ncbi:proton channel OTOP2-like [Gastrophryne carolinensis]
MDDPAVENNSVVTASTSITDTKAEKSLGHHLEITDKPSALKKKVGRLLSGVLGMNILLLAIVLVSCAAFNEVVLVEREVLSYLCFLMALSACWMLLYLLWTSRKKNSMSPKDSHAGPVWLRVGLVVFGVCSIVLDVLKIGKSVSLVNCESPVKIVYPVFQGSFVVIQTFFLWVSSKDCSRVHMTLTRCGLMLTLSTNLSIWMAAVTDESLHQTPSDSDNNSSSVHRIVRAGGGSSGCYCDNDVCKAFETGYYYLYPFNIEYSLFASALSYVMWKNVGRVIPHGSDHGQHSFHPQRLFVGLICGVGVLVAGIAIFIVYDIEISSKTEQSLVMFYIFNIVALTLMSVSSLAGSILFRFDKRDTDSHKNPTRSLDVGLLIMAALGKYCISYFSVIAIVAAAPKNQIDSLNLVYSLLMIIQHTLQNIFIIEGLHREPFHGVHLENQNSGASDGRHDVYINPVATASQGKHPENENEYELESNNHVTEPRSIVPTTHSDWKRKFVKEISLFLLLSNIIFWIMPAFGARPQFDNDMELKFYGRSLWTAIVNIGLPFGIFYRMHAVASLLEIYVIA